MKSHRITPSLVMLTLIAALIVAGGPARIASAATFTVTKTADTADGKCNADCSLREAIMAANARAGQDTIRLQAGTYRLRLAGKGEDASATGDLDISGELLITGAGAATTIIDGSAQDRVVHVLKAAKLTLARVTIRNGNIDLNGGGIYNTGSLHLTSSVVRGNTAEESGGGIANETSATTTLRSSTVRDNKAGEGGGLYNSGQLALIRTVVQNNESTFFGGGGIFSGSNLTLQDSTVSANIATEDGGGILTTGNATIAGSIIRGNSTIDGSGGGITNGGRLSLHGSTVSYNIANSLDGGGGLNNSGEATLGNSTVNSNSAREVGGGIRNTGMLALANVTISGNSAIEHGGGIYTFDTRATVHLANVTIVNNRADSDGDGSGGGGGIAVQSSIARFKNTLLGGNRAAAGMGADCSGTLTSQGYNLIQVGTGCTVAGNRTGNLLGRDPRIDPLANNGGSTFTHALRSNSPAINTGNPAGCTDKDGTFLRFDQRGVERPQGKACDIGAYERQVAQ